MPGTVDARPERRLGAVRHRPGDTGVTERPDQQTESAALRDVAVEETHRLLAELHIERRQAIALCFYGGFTQREVTQRLELPIGTAKVRIRRGLVRMRDALGNE